MNKPRASAYPWIHGLVQSRGGAARIAQTLHQLLPGAGLLPYRSFEVRDGAKIDPAREGLCKPSDLGASAGPDTLVHIHGTRDWPGLLKGLAHRSGPTVITIHDCGLLTGGCAYPLECREWETGCPASCARGFPEADQMCREIRDLVNALSPVLVSPSRWLAQKAKKVFGDLPVRIIPNGVSYPETLSPKARARKKVGLGPGAKLVLFTACGGAKAAYKSGDRWRGLWEQIKAQVPKAAGFMVGGDKSEQTHDLAKWPYVDQKTMALFMRAADVLAYPSLADNHPLVVLEAMAAGLPCVASAVGGIPEQIMDRENGFLVAPGKDEDLVEKIVFLLNHPALAKKMGAVAHAFGRTRFSQGRMAGDYVKVYKEIA